MTENGIRYPFLDLGAANARYRTDLHEAALRVIDSGRYIGGEETEAFNRILAAMCDAPYAIGTSNGLDALRLVFEGYKTMGKLKDGDEIIVPSNTYIATVLAIMHAGLSPVLVDPDPVTMNLSSDGIFKAITPKTRAIAIVHLFGRVCWNEDISALILENGLIAVEDVAQAIGGQSISDGLSGSRHAGALGHAGAFSFYPTKNIGALGDAGAIVTHDADLANTVKALANYGSDRRYHNIYAGFNCRMDPIQAAMLRIKLKDTDGTNARRFARAVIYDRHISNPAIAKPPVPAYPMQCVWHQYVVRISADRRDIFRRYMIENGVETDVHYPTPPHLQPCLTNLTHGPLPVAEQLAAESVSLPIGDPLDETDTKRIADLINEFSD